MKNPLDVEGILMEHTKVLENHEVRLQNVEKILDSKKWAVTQTITSIVSGGIVAVITLLLTHMGG